MPAKRRLAKTRPYKITPEVIETFRRLQKLGRSCTCPPRDWSTDSRYRDPCAACNSWWDEYFVLHKALNLMPHQWPGISHPDATCPYPAGCYAAEHWHRERQGETQQQAIALYRELEEASRALAKAQRGAR